MRILDQRNYRAIPCALGILLQELQIASYYSMQPRFGGVIMGSKTSLDQISTPSLHAPIEQNLVSLKGCLDLAHGFRQCT